MSTSNNILPPKGLINRVFSKKNSLSNDIDIFSPRAHLDESIPPIFQNNYLASIEDTQHIQNNHINEMMEDLEELIKDAQIFQSNQIKELMVALKEIKESFSEIALSLNNSEGGDFMADNMEQLTDKLNNIDKKLSILEEKITNSTNNNEKDFKNIKENIDLKLINVEKGIERIEKRLDASKADRNSKLASWIAAASVIVASVGVVVTLVQG